TWRAAVDGQIADVQPPHFKVVYGQGAQTPAPHGERTNGETSYSERTDGGSPKGNRTECYRTKTEGASRAHRLLICRDVASGRLNLSNFSGTSLRVVHGLPLSSAVVLTTSERCCSQGQRQGQRNICLTATLRTGWRALASQTTL